MAAAHTLVRGFVDAITDPTTRAAAMALDPRVLEPRLAALVEDAAATTPLTSVSPSQFMAHVGARLPVGDDPLQALTQLHGQDLYLAAACTASDPEAIAVFETRFDIEIRTALSRYRDVVAEEDFRQSLREKLFVASGDKVPGIAQYAGRGELRYWVKMTIVRALTDWMRRRNVRRREVTVAEQTIDVLLAPTTDPEIEYLKSLYRAQFRAALANTLEQLEARERNLLRYSVADGLSIDEIGVIYQVHRSTAARWLNKARDALIEGVSALLRKRLAVDPSEFQSILRLIQSRVDVNVAQMLE